MTWWGFTSIRPEHAIVLSVGEKSQIQALDRTQPGLPLKKGRAATMTHDYKRNGTTTLFAAFDVLEGKITGRCMQKHRHQEFIRFLNQIEAQVPAKKAVHVNATHKHPKVCVSPSISRPPPHRGSMPSKASSPNSPNDASSAASFDPSGNSGPPSTASSMRPITIPSPSHGPQTQTKSSPPSNEGTNC